MGASSAPDDCTSFARTSDVARVERSETRAIRRPRQCEAHRRVPAVRTQGITPRLPCPDSRPQGPQACAPGSGACVCKPRCCDRSLCRHARGVSGRARKPFRLACGCWSLVIASLAGLRASRGGCARSDQPCVRGRWSLRLAFAMRPVEHRGVRASLLCLQMLWNVRRGEDYAQAAGQAGRRN
jgi:hypothetical protein